MKIKAKFDGKADYRGSLDNMGTGGHILGLTQAVRKQIGKSFGDIVCVEIWQDTNERIVEIPVDVQVVFNENPDVFDLYDRMSYTHRKEYMRWITEAKITKPAETGR